jgi:transcriptional regulator with PAS, ATPase and Fis domain
MMKGRNGVAGLVLVDDFGDISFAVGLGKDPRITNLVSHREWRATASKQRLVTIDLDDKSNVVLIWLPVENHNLGVLVDQVAEPVFEFLTEVDFSWDIINHLITDPFNAMTVVDRHARIVYLSPVHEGFFGLDRGAAVGQPVSDVIENTRLDRVTRTGKAEVGDVQRMRGEERVVNRTPIFRGDDLVGAIGRVMFKGPEQVQTLSRRVNALEKEVEFYRRETQALRREAFDLDTIVGNSDAIRRLKDDIVRVAPLDIPVLVLGESGTGKELVAYAMHRLSPRRGSKLVVVNSAALPGGLVESELFGYEPGAFTGADRKGRRGKFEQANGSTLFLDEVGDMPVDVQAKLLRVLQDKTVQRVGGELSREVDFRLIAATNRDLRSLMSKQDFRLDFYYRISPVVLTVPPLRSRLADIPLLVEKFLSEFSVRHQRVKPEVDPDLYAFLADQDWPGNIRQLRHAVERAVIFADGNRLGIVNFERSDAFMQQSNQQQSIVYPSVEGTHGLHGTLDRVENKLIQDALVRFKGNKKKVAAELGISRSYLYKKLGAI